MASGFYSHGGRDGHCVRQEGRFRDHCVRQEGGFRDHCGRRGGKGDCDGRCHEFSRGREFTLSRDGDRTGRGGFSGNKDIGSCGREFRRGRGRFPGNRNADSSGREFLGGLGFSGSRNVDSNGIGFCGGRGFPGGIDRDGSGRGFRGSTGGFRGSRSSMSHGSQKCSKKTIIELHRHEDIFVARGVQDALLTLNFAPRVSVYNEKIITIEDENGKCEYRTWNPFRSKLAAAVVRSAENIYIKRGLHVHYLSAASGTTSRVSDMVGPESLMQWKYAMEFSVKRTACCSKREKQYSANYCRC